MVSCHKCNSDIPSGRDAMKCTACGFSYHLACCHVKTVGKLKKMSEIAVSAWRCDVCVSGVQSNSDNEDSPVVVNLLKDLKKEMEESRKFNSEKFENIEKGISTVSVALEEVKSKICAVEADNVVLKTEVSNIIRDNERLSCRVRDLESELSDLQQYSRINNVEIRGIPPSRGEDIYSVLQAVARAIGVTFQRHDISVAHRLPAPKDKRFFPSIVVQFISRTIRSQWLLAAREKKIKASDLAAAFPPTPVFIFDHLTAHKKVIFAHAKSLVKQGKLVYAWSRDCRIFIRRTADSPATRVRSTAEVEAEVSRATVADEASK